MIAVTSVLQRSARCSKVSAHSAKCSPGRRAPVDCSPFRAFADSAQRAAAVGVSHWQPPRFSDRLGQALSVEDMLKEVNPIGPDRTGPDWTLARVLRSPFRRN